MPTCWHRDAGQLENWTCCKDTDNSGSAIVSEGSEQRGGGVRQDKRMTPSWYREGRGRIARNSKTMFFMGSAIGLAVVGVAGACVYVC